MKIEKSLKKHLRRRHSNRKLTTQDQQEKLEAMESNPPEQKVFQFDDEAFLKEIS